MKRTLIYLITYLPFCIQLAAAEAQPLVDVPETGPIDLTAPQTTLALLARIFMFLGILAAASYGLLWISKRGRLPMSLKKKSGSLTIKETHMLGNKQFLVVVQYGEQKILLGVGPGMIQHLCYLNTPYDDAKALWKEANAPLAQQE